MGAGRIGPQLAARIIDEWSEAALVVGADGTVVAVNQAAEATFRRPLTSMVGRPLDDLLSHPVPLTGGGADDASEDGDPGSVTRPRRWILSRSAVRGDGTEAPVEIVGTSITSAGRTWRVVVVSEAHRDRTAEAATWLEVLDRDRRQIASTLDEAVVGRLEGASESLHRCGTAGDQEVRLLVHEAEQQLERALIGIRSVVSGWKTAGEEGTEPS